MKPVFILTISLLFSLSCHSQTEPMTMKGQDTGKRVMKTDNAKAMPMGMSMNMPGKTHLPFYTKKGNRVIYHLYISDTIVNYTGKKRKALAINGSIPAPALTFTEGDTAEIYVHNSMMMETSIHWHGLLLPNRYDGVSFLT
ncbi:cupredoxin domain-containing protein [Ferruginibacter profundus]